MKHSRFVLPVLALALFGCGEGPTNPVAKAPAAPSGPQFHIAGEGGAGPNAHGELLPTITAPAAGATFLAGTSIAIQWNAPSDGGLQRYRLKVECSGTACRPIPEMVIPATPGLPWQLTWNFPAGIYTAYVRGEKTTGGNNPQLHASAWATRTFNVEAPPPKQNQTITFTFPTGYGKTYGDPQFDLSDDPGGIREGVREYSTSGLPVTLTSLKLGVCEVLANKHVVLHAAGTCTIRATQAGNDDFFPADPVEQSFTVAKAPLTVTAENKQKTYDGLEFSPFTVAYSGFVYGETESVLGGSLGFAVNQASGNTNAYPGAGAYDVVPSGRTSDNYAITFVNGTLQIDRAPLTITAFATPDTKVYDGAGFAVSTFAVNYSGFVNGETATVLGGLLAFDVIQAAGNTNPYPGAGAFELVPSGLTSKNYLITFRNGSLTIQKAPAKIILSNLTQAYTGLPLAPTATTVPAGLTIVDFAYSIDGVPVAPPVNTGVYKVDATLGNPNYYGSADGFLAIYDPNGGFVSGGGWINSPEGACRTWSGCAAETVGKADFGFVSKYVPGKSTPTGSTVFQFHAGGLNFKSTTYETLVVAADRAQYWGVGTVNGAAGYSFRVTAVDAQVNGSSAGADRFRIEIWLGSRDTGTKIYDNQWGAAQDAALTTAIAGGSISIKK